MLVVCIGCYRSFHLVHCTVLIHMFAQQPAPAIVGGGLLHIVPMGVGVSVPKELQGLKYKAVLIEVTEDVCVGAL